MIASRFRRAGISAAIAAIALVAAACSSGEVEDLTNSVSGTATAYAATSAQATAIAASARGSSATATVAASAVASAVTNSGSTASVAPAQGSSGSTTTSDPNGQTATGTFFLDIETPAEADAFVSTDILEVAGRTTLDAIVIVNDSIVDIDADGRFVSSVILTEGPNVVEVVASSADGEQLDRVLLIIYEPV